MYSPNQFKSMLLKPPKEMSKAGIKGIEKSKFQSRKSSKKSLRGSVSMPDLKSVVIFYFSQ